MAHWTQRETMHMMGEGFSYMRYEIRREGELTPIIRFIQTDGRPYFHKIVDQLECGKHVFELGTAKTADIHAWCERAIECRLDLPNTEPAGDIPMPREDV